MNALIVARKTPSRFLIVTDRKTQSDEEELVSIEPTADDLFYTNWARNVYEGRWKFVADSLRELVVVNTVLFGGSLAFLDEKVLHQGFRTPVVICFLISLIISLHGMVPVRRVFDLTSVPQAKANYRRSLNRKGWSVQACFGFLVLGLVLVMIGVAFR